MKIRDTIVLILALPIACQLLTAGMLTVAYSRVDELGTKERQAKQVVAKCISINAAMDQLVLIFSSGSLLGDGERFMGAREIREMLKADFVELEELTKGSDRAHKMVLLYASDCDRFIDDVRDLAKGFKPASHRTFFSQFLAHDDFFESLSVTYTQTQKDADELVKMYAPVAQEFGPQAVAARENLRKGTWAAVLLNLFLVVALAVAVNRNTISRLSMLMNSLRSFARGEKMSSVSLGGNDELADVYRSLSEIWAERQKLEDLRKSIRSMVNHDLRSPLSTMGMRLELILSHGEGNLDPDLEKQLRILEEETQRLWRLSNTLLDIDKMEDGSLEVSIRPIPVCDVIDFSVNAVEMQAKRREIQILSSQWDDIVCLCDEDRTVQVLINLLSNAIKFSPNKATITLSVKRAEQNTVRFEVRDQGKGVPSDDVHMLFGKFSQLDQPEDIKKSGSGLGLYICRMLITAQGGNIGYESNEPAGGACFWFDLPLAPQMDQLASAVN